MNNLKVIVFSLLGDNPYTDFFVKHLTDRNVQVAVEEKNLNFIFLSKVIEKGKPDILHLHTIHYFFLGRNPIHRWIKFLIFIGQICILKSIGVKVVWTVHEWTDRFSAGKHNIHLIWAIILGRLFHAIITHCETTKTQIIKALRLENKNKVFSVYHGNYIGAYKNEISQGKARQTLGITPGHLVFLLFGNIHRSKGFLPAISTFKSLQENQVSLLIAGFPAEPMIEEEIREIIQGCDNIFFFPKRVPDDEIQFYMHACDCVIFPYKTFTTSGATILAMSFGKACIAPNVGFFGDVLDNAGAFLYDLTNKDGLRQAMQQAINKKDNISDKGKHNLQLAEQWNWDYVAEETIKIYHSCLDLN
ncbi:MAG: glycosyltransferase family 4 protein [Coleofasciculus chthonoplastes F3-SA18-01]|uniref:glycosyltransferase family 4 protein n=1 Tax=Coleofasciculus chthonoplastes TaxID=64178 RepID=UPI003302620E